MKKSFEYDLTKYDPNAPTRTEQFLTADGTKTLTTDANNGAVLIQDSVDPDSLNPVTAAAVATAIEQGGGGGGVPDTEVPLYINPDDEVALRFGSGLTLEEGEATDNDTLAVALSGTGGLCYDDMEENALAVQLDPAGGIENAIDDGEQVGLRVKVDGTSIDINASGELEAIGGGGSSYTAGSGVNIANDVISLNIGTGLKFQGAGGPVYVQYPLPTPKTLSAQGKYLQVTDSEYGSMAWTAINGVPDYTISDAGKVLTVNSGATGVEWATPSGGGASGYFVPFYDSTMQMIDGTVITAYGTYIEGDVASRLAQYWDDTSIHQIAINLPASMGPANDLYAASLFIELQNSSTPSDTIYLVRSTYSSNVGLGDIPPNYSYGNMSFNFTIGPREWPTGYVISSFRFHIEDSTNDSQSLSIPDWINLDSTQIETWSRNTAGITLTQIPVSITAV